MSLAICNQPRRSIRRRRREKHWGSHLGDEPSGLVLCSQKLRQACIISLTLPLSFVPQVVTPQLARVTYTGGYVMPGTTPSAGHTGLPANLETAAIEQDAAWFQQRDKLGLIRHWPSGGTYLVLTQLPLLPQVTTMIRPFQRWTV